MDDVWDRNWFGSTKTLDVHIAALRRHLEASAAAFDPPAQIAVITTLRRHDYRLESAAGDQPTGTDVTGFRR